MSDDSLYFILVNSCLANNIVLASLLGISPMVEGSARRSTALQMGLSVIVALLVSSLCAFVVNGILVATGTGSLRLIAFSAVIATAVQVTDMFHARHCPGLRASIGGFLPAMVVNYAVLGLALTQSNREYNLLQCLAYALGSGGGFMLVVLLMSGMREHLALNEMPRCARGTGMVLILAGILSLAFMGFAGLGN